MLSIVLILTLTLSVVVILNSTQKPAKLEDGNKETIIDTVYESNSVDEKIKTEKTTQKDIKSEKKLENSSSNIIIKSNKSGTDKKEHSESKYDTNHFQKDDNNQQENIDSDIQIHYTKSDESSGINKPKQKSANNYRILTFRNNNLLTQHYNKHGSEMGCSSAEEYESAAARVAGSSSASRKTQKDGDTCYYIDSTREFVVVSKDGYIRTYFKASKSYFNKQ